MSHWLIDELGHEDYGSHDAGDEADGTNDDVEVGQAHGGAVAEEAEKEKYQNTNTNNKVDCNQSHIYDIIVA